MCFRCQSSFGMIQTGLSWAIPVDIVTLGSHLEAYMDIKLQVHAFRVCSRFGKGPEVFVNKIPHELIDIIINHLVQPVRLQYFESWMKLHNCFQGSCEPFEHECFHDLDVIDDVCTCERDSDWGESGWEECKCYESDEFFDLSMENYDPFEECIPNQMKWRNLVQQPSTGLVENVPRANVEKYGFAKYDEVLRKDFGLQASICYVSIPDHMMKVMGLDWLSYAPSASCRTTISYLTLPYTRITQHLHARDVVTDDFQEAFTNMSQIVDPTSLTLSKEQKSRFTRAMRVLDLQPFVHFMQAFNLGNYIQSSPKLKAINCPATINTMSETEKAQLKEGVSSLIGEIQAIDWPQLLTLANSSMEYCYW